MITFSAVTKRFGDGTVALDNVSFHVEPGELVVVTGPTGSGKTTLMKMLIRDLRPTEGEVWYNDVSLADLTPKDIPLHRRKIGVVFQDYKLLSELNVWENIALPLSIMGKSEGEIESRVTDLLNLTNLTDRALVFPKQLSGGEAQRVSLARALATGPNLIFADEPTGNLDKKSSLEIAKLLQQINSFGTTVLIVTHDVTILDYLENERHLMLEHGQLMHDSRPGKPKERAQKLELEPEKPAEKAEEKEVEKVDQTEKNEQKGHKKKAAKKAKQDKAATNLADEFQLANFAAKPPAKKLSWLPKVRVKIPIIKLPKFGKKEKDA